MTDQHTTANDEREIIDFPHADTISVGVLTDDYGDEINAEVAGLEAVEDLIARPYFPEYVRELIGAIPSEYTWPISHTDWEQATRELAMDYSLVTIGGRDYYAQ